MIVLGGAFAHAALHILNQNRGAECQIISFKTLDAILECREVILAESDPVHAVSESLDKAISLSLHAATARCKAKSLRMFALIVTKASV